MTDDGKALVARLRNTDENIAYAFPHSHQKDCVEAADRIEAQAAEIERLREALEFYAGWGVTNPVYDTVVILDGGDKARAALGETE